MLPLFDIFQLQADDSLGWLEAADTTEAAQMRINTLAQSAPGRYIVFNQQTGQSLVLDAPTGRKSATTSSG